MASAVPAMAASHKATATTTTPHFYQIVDSFVPTTTCSTSNPIKGYIDAMPCNSPVTPSNSDCKNNPSSSDGFWINSANGGTVNDQTITVTYKFSQAVVLDQCPVGGKITNEAGTSTIATSCNVISSGWTVTQTNSTTIVATYSRSSDVTTQKTNTTGQNSATGYYLNFHAPSCYAEGKWTVATTATWVYSNAASTQTWTTSKAAFTIS